MCLRRDLPVVLTAVGLGMLLALVLPPWLAIWLLATLVLCSLLSGRR